MAAVAEDLTLLLLSADDWRQLGSGHLDPTRNPVALASLVEPWIDGGPPPSAATLRVELPKSSGSACERALDPLVSGGAVEQQRAASRLGRAFRSGQAKYWRVVDRAGRQAVFDRVAASLGGTTPPSRPDATLAVLLWASGTWDRARRAAARPLRLDGRRPRAVGSARRVRPPARRGRGGTRRGDRPGRAAAPGPRAVPRRSRGEPRGLTLEQELCGVLGVEILEFVARARRARRDRGRRPGGARRRRGPPR